jgi:hypothetical protein
MWGGTSPGPGVNKRLKGLALSWHIIGKSGRSSWQCIFCFWFSPHRVAKSSISSGELDQTENLCQRSSPMSALGEHLPGFRLSSPSPTLIFKAVGPMLVPAFLTPIKGTVLPSNFTPHHRLSQCSNDLLSRDSCKLAPPFISFKGPSTMK